MDPTTTLSEILTILSAPVLYSQSAALRLRDLADWIEKGGFAPDVDRAITSMEEAAE